jgi:hypothetical protein
MSLTKCPDCRRLSFVKADSCPSCARVFRPGEIGPQADAENRAFVRRSNGLFAGLFLMALAAIAYVMLRGLAGKA